LDWAFISEYPLPLPARLGHCLPLTSGTEEEIAEGKRVMKKLWII